MPAADHEQRVRLVVALAALAAAGAQTQACDVLATPAESDAAAAVPAPQPALDEGDRSAADRHAGTFAFSGGEAERAAVIAAIEDVVAEMNPLARSIARGRLQEANRVPERIEISRTDDLVAIQFDDRRYEAPLDGSPVEVVGVTGDTLTYRLSVRQERVRQSFVGDKGGRENTLALQGGKGMTLRVRVSSESLPKPLVYRLSYRRK